MPSFRIGNQVSATVIKVGKQGVIYQQKDYREKSDRVLRNSKGRRAYGSTREESIEYKDIILDRTAAEIIDQINQRIKSPYHSLYCSIISVLLVIVSFQISFFLGVLLLVSSLITTSVIYSADLKRKTTPLSYQFSDKYSEMSFEHKIKSFSKLSLSNSSWRLKSKVAVNDWKRNAGSNSALIRHKAKIGKQKPTLIKTNVEVWGIDAGSIKLYLFPDCFFVFQDGIYNTITYNELQASFQNLEYVEEESLPKDATITGETWKYVRRDGGPDKRFKNNYQIPIVKYGLISFSSLNFVAHLIVSDIDIAYRFARSFSSSIGQFNSSYKMLSESNHKPSKIPVEKQF